MKRRIGYPIANSVAIVALILLSTLSTFAQAPAKFTSASLVDTGYEALAHGGQVQSIASGDFNGDGKQDLLTIGVCSCPPAYELFLGNGNGTFSSKGIQTLSQRNANDGIAENNANVVAVGDFNGDGHLDFAVYMNGGSGSGSDYLDVYLGDGTGSFTFSNNYTVGKTGATGIADGVTAADVNGDGKLDLLAINSGDNSVTVLLGKGNGTFQTGVLYSACTVTDCEPIAITTGDFKNDGHPDIAIVDNAGGIDILLNNGAGTFAAPVYYSAPGCATASPCIQGFPYGESGIAAADLRSDNKIDVVITSDTGVWVYLGNGNGTFQKPVNYAFPYGDTVAIVDVNGDKKLDLVAPDLFNNSVWVLLGNGDGTFKPGVAYATDWSPESVVVADFNQDGKLDFAVGSDTSPMVTLALGNGDGTFRAGQNYDIGNWGGEVAADFNGDGNLDVAVYVNGTIQVMLGNSHGILGSPITTTFGGGNLIWMAAADVNGDGKQDLVGAFQGPNPSEIVVLIGNGNGTFKTPVFYSTGSSENPAFMVLGDFNNDGKPDAVVSNADGSISVLLNKGGGVFGTATVIPGATKAGAWLATGDFNKDGKLDLVAADSGDNSVNILLGKGNGTFDSPSATEVDHSPGWVTVGDFNKDGNLDVATGGNSVGSDSFNDGGIAILLGNGEGALGSPTYYSLYPNTTNVSPSAAVVADVNGDGNPDLLVSFATTHISFQCCFAPANVGIGIFLGKGDGTFEFENAEQEAGVVGGPFLIGTGSYDLVAGDFNNDGAIDAAVLNQYNFGGGSGLAYVTMLLNTTLPISISPLTAKFGAHHVGTPSTGTVVITNNSTSSDSVVASLSGADAKDFTFSGCTAKLNGGGQHCTITVTFTPSAGGKRTATLNLTIGGKAYASQLTGTGLALTVTPTSLNFGSVTVGKHSSPMPVSVKNNSSSSIDIVSPGITISGSPLKDYTQTNNCGSSIAPGVTCTIEVTFSPKKTGTRTGTLEINDNDGNSPQKVALTGSGS